MININSPKGSEWHSWDYHIHTPASYCYADRGVDAYQKIANVINASECSAFGINDYLTIEGYLKIKGMVSRPVFPVIEFRMTNILANKKGGNPHLNFHLLFSNEDEYLPKIKAFLGSLQFEDFEGRKRNLTEEEILDFSKKQVAQQETVKEKLIHAALEKIKFDFGYVLDAVTDKGLREHCLSIVPYDEYGGIDGINPYDGGLIKSGLIKRADIIGSSSSIERDYFLGKAKDKYTPEQFKLWVGKPKPILKGSDAHTSLKIGILPPKADGVALHCWVKSDLTFEGLKQILYEPEQRAYVGNIYPDNKDKSKVITSLSVRGAGGWFEDQKIDFNRDLVSIIGGKGSGKTALVDLVGLAGGSFDRANKSSFLSKAGRELIGAKLLLQWEDGTTESELEIKKEIESLKEQKVRYLSQSFVESLCSFDKHEDLEREIEEILFQYIPGSKRLGAESFEVLKLKQTEAVALAMSQISSEIIKINNEIHEIEQLIASRAQLVNDKEQIDRSITELHKQKPQPSTEEERKTADELKKLSDQRAVLASQIEQYRIKATKIEVLQRKLLILTDSVTRFNQEAAATLAEIGEAALLSSISGLVPTNAQSVLKAKADELLVNIAKLEGSDEPFAESPDTLSVVDLKISELNQKSSGEVQKRIRLQEFAKRISEHTLKRDALNQRIIEIDKVSQKALDSKRQERIQLLTKYFEKLEEKRKVLEELYEPLNSRKGASDEESKVKFYARFTFDAAKFGANAEAIFDSRKSVVRGGEKAFAEAGLRFWEELASALPTFNTRAIDSLVSVLQKKDDGTRSIAEQLRAAKSNRDFYQWLYSTSYYDVEYGIRYEGTDLDKLSPGKKGVVLLLIYLTIDTDYRPLIIDQPEENLDNRSIYTTLVEYFRRAKRNRQVIIVTHNANLVVNGDAEQIVVANFEKDCATQKARIKYISGPLEHTQKKDTSQNILESQGIREHVCELLEGGTTAFEKREEKYRFPRD